MNYVHLFEATMLVCFGFSWPLNVVKAYKARTAKGTSLPFIILIITGYIAGIMAKILNGQFNYVLTVYFINLAIVMTNVFVYIRNKALDKKNEGTVLQVTKLDINGLDIKEDIMTNYTNSFDELINRKPQEIEKKNAVILLGDARDKMIPVESLAKNFNFNFPIYNKSEDSISVSSVQNYFQSHLESSKPEGILIHIGENDISMFKNDSTSFDRSYLAFVEYLKAFNKKCRLALVSLDNPNNDKTIKLMNSHIKAIADAEKVPFINLENARLWNPEATKAAIEFAYSMGLSIRKPLQDVAEILYSYAYNNIQTVEPETHKTA